jgi:hypothetical protein
LLYEKRRSLVPGNRPNGFEWRGWGLAGKAPGDLSLVAIRRLWCTLAHGGESFMLRALLAASMAFLPAAQPFAQGSGQVPAAPAKPLTLAQVWTLNGTYNDPQQGVSFRYPAVWQATTQFAYHPPALTQADVAKPIAAFGYSEGGFPRKQLVGPYGGTNLEGVSLVYSAVPAAGLAECSAEATSVSGSPKGLPVRFGDRSFSVYETESAGMSQSTSGKLYATYAGSTCYLFETDVAVVSPGVVDNIQALTPAQLSFIDSHLVDIIKSVQIMAGH